VHIVGFYYKNIHDARSSECETNERLHITAICTVNMGCGLRSGELAAAYTETP